MKKQLLLLLSVLLTSLTASAYDFEADGIYYNILSEEDLTCEVAQSPNRNYWGDVVIPSAVTNSGKTYSVVAVGKSAFIESYLYSVKIPSSVTTIGEDAFCYCQELTSVEIPNSVTTIGKSAFYCCRSLISVDIPNSVTTLGKNAFYECEGITSVNLSCSLTTIEEYTFYLSGLKSVTIPNSVKSIGAAAFSDCYDLSSVDIPNSVTTIGKYAFRDCI